MRVPLSWLREYVDFDWTPEELADRLTALGMEVQAIERIGEEWTNVVVGELLAVGPHPNSDRLSLTSVRVGDDGVPLSIVCGATNIAVGQRVPVALPGSTLPGGRQIGASTIAGVESQGMLASGAELGLSADADGILILDDGAKVGMKLADLVGDVVLDVDVKPNRGDALSLIGLAREVAALTGGSVRWPAVEVPESGDATADHLAVEVLEPALCPRFVGRWVDGVKVGPSPISVQLRLSAAGLRPVSNVVDASNYVMLELGKPIHTFDAAVVSGGRIVVRRARPGETLETLDHVERALTEDTLLIADPEKALGIAGVMGGAGSEVSDATTAVIIESAVFDPVSIRRTARRYALRSEASQRFEKGQESRLARLGADRAAQLIAQWAAGRVATGVVDTNPVDEAPRRVSFRPARVNRLLGTDIPETEMRELLQRVGIATEAGPDGGSGAVAALVPPHRRDIAIEADLAEEVARLRGYETIAPSLPDTLSPPYRPDPRRSIDTLRELLAGRGLSEVVTEELISPADHAALAIPAGDPATVRVANSISIDRSELRRSLLPGLLRVVRENERQRRQNVVIFEVGPVHSFAGAQPVQREMLGVVLAGEWRMASWAGPAQVAEVADIKGVIEVLVDRLNAGRVEYAATQALAGVEHPGRTATVVLAGETGREIGRVGELDPRYLRANDLRAEHVTFALVDLDELKRRADAPVRIAQPGRLPAVERDLAVVVHEDTAQSRVADAIRSAGADALAALTLFDRYQGPPLATDEVSLAYRLRFEPDQQPLTEQEIDAVMVRVARALGGLGARIRGPEETA
jgi:phenylalanyl-tRNA synthetase beta chain